MSGQSMTDEEYSLIRDYLILPFVRNMVKNNSEKVKDEGLTLGSLFVKSSEVMLKLIDKDIYETRRQIGKLQAKITESKRNEDGILYEVRLRGYVQEIALLRHVVKREMADKSEKYIRMMFK
ncbi:hypothetical protein [Paenibacillus glycanilyticus]|uniref:hypothetical protein n=1 Tax=Paenibacillus glycanilyticus TaxID=126569 RepID=UPI0019103E84|nr:hypothetical protein [Paenibacillus glycanilyticus]